MELVKYEIEWELQFLTKVQSGREKTNGTELD
jgi:hypothetical protein